MHNRRLSSVDICRGIAILLMIETHISSHLLPYPTCFGSLGTFAGAMAAPFFLIISGVSYDLFLISRLRKDFSINYIFMESFFKGILVYILPLIPYLLIGIIYPSKYELRFIHWGVFQVIGFGYIFGFLIPRNITGKLLSIIFIFIITFAIHNYYFETFYFLLTDNFPLLPFIGYFLFGRLFYELYSRSDVNHDNSILLISSAFFVISLLLFDALNIEFSSVTSHQISFGQIPMFLILCSIQFFVLSLLIVFVDGRTSVVNLFNPLIGIGKIAFTNYYAHFLIIYLLIFLASIFDCSLKSLASVMNLIFLLFIFLILSHFEKMWKQYNYIFGFEWIIRKGVYIIMKSFYNQNALGFSK